MLYKTEDTRACCALSHTPFSFFPQVFFSPCRSISAMRPLLLLLALGVFLSGYAYYVEYKAAEAKKLGTRYVALCDIGVFSCTKVFSSEFGYASQLLGLPKISNAVVGMAFYAFEILIERYTTLLLATSGASCIASFGLFYLLTIKLNDFCLVCFSIYVINFTTFFTTLRRFRKAQTPKRVTKSK